MKHPFPYDTRVRFEDHNFLPEQGRIDRRAQAKGGGYVYIVDCGWTEFVIHSDDITHIEIGN